MITRLTLQQVFDNALNGVRKQGRLSQNDKYGCYYRYPDNPAVRCGIGHSIPDELYKRELEGASVLGLMEYEDSHLSPLLPTDVAAVQLVQRAHDDAADLDEFEAKMQSTAERLNLVWTPKAPA